MLPISIIRIDSMSYQTPSAQLIPDPLLPGKFMLVLVGSDANDFISVRPMPFSSVGMLAQSYAVNIGGGPSLLFDFVTGHIKIDANAGHDNIYIYPKIKNPTIINGGAGNDTIFSGMGNDLITGGPGNDSMFAGLGKDELVETGDVNMTLVQGTVFVNGSMTGGLGTDVLVKNSFEGARLTGGASGNTLDATAFTAPVFLFGLGGNDVLRGGTKSDVLVGGDDQDMLVGNNGRDLLIGGLGLDLLEGGAHDDILIGGETSFDTDVAALQSIMAEWTRPNITYKGRILHLQGSPGGKNGTILLTNLTVFDDAGAVDTLRGQTYFDWFFNSVNDVLVDPFATETVTNIP
jgi:Ca2+-binding RTX toxin-like protein